jgi:hypothetical protein
VFISAGEQRQKAALTHSRSPEQFVRRSGPDQLARQLNQSGSQPQPENLDVLAAAYEEVGRFSEAIEAAQAAMKLTVIKFIAFPGRSGHELAIFRLVRET